MSVLLETSLGDIVIDLETELCPKACQNFLKLCQKHYYKFNAFFSVQRDFLAQTGDPTNTGKGGESIWSLLPASSSSKSASPYFTPEKHPTLKHRSKGTVSFACTSVGQSGGGINDDDLELLAGSQFFITLTDNIEYLNGKHAPFGTVVEGQEEGGTLDKINQAFVDEQQRPLKDIRIRHVVVLEDPFEDPEGFQPPSRSPSPTPEQAKALRLADTEEVEEERDAAEAEEARRKADSSAAALTLEMVGDLPFAEIRPPENILFVCKLNPNTRGEDLELIFSRFGKILSCEVIRDKKTGDSLQYAFIEFDQKEDAERAYFKMQNVLIDDRRIWVDFSQSVSKLHGDWLRKRNGGREPPPGYYDSHDDRRHGRGGDRGSRGGSRGGSSRGSEWRRDGDRERPRDRDRYRDDDRDSYRPSNRDRDGRSGDSRSSHRRDERRSSGGGRDRERERDRDRPRDRRDYNGREAERDDKYRRQSDLGRRERDEGRRRRSRSSSPRR